MQAEAVGQTVDAAVDVVDAGGGQRTRADSSVGFGFAAGGLFGALAGADGALGE
ncbi:hypothetical protein NORO109296_21130 [Nocardiopsis rhodophaea]